MVFIIDINLEVVEQASEPYSPSWSPAVIDIPPVTFAAIVLVIFLLYGVPFGVLQFVGSDATHLAGSAIAGVVFFGVFMTIFQLTMGRGVPSVLIGLAVDASLIWLTIVVFRGLCASPAHRSAPSR